MKTSSIVMSHSRPVVVFEVVVIARLGLFFGAMLFSGAFWWRWASLAVMLVAKYLRNLWTKMAPSSLNPEETDEQSHGGLDERAIGRL